MSEQIPQQPTPVSQSEERQWAMIAHLSVWINVATVFMGAVVPLIIYFLYKDKSKFVAFHAMQAFVMQAACSFLGMLATVLSSAASMSGIVICIPFACIFGLLPLASFVFGTIAGIQVNKGEDYKYPVVGDFVQNNIVK